VSEDERDSEASAEHADETVPEKTAAEPATEPEPAGDSDAEPTVAIPPSAPSAPRRLERSRDDRVIAGVCGGLGEYLGVDAVLIRIAALFLVFAGGAGIVLYVIGWIAMPDGHAPEPGEEPVSASTEPSERTRGAVLLGLVFVALGAFFLVDEIWADVLAWKYVWPIALIAVGAVVLLRARQ
jgi:phage shock protein C